MHALQYSATPKFKECKYIIRNREYYPPFTFRVVVDNGEEIRFVATIKNEGPDGYCWVIVSDVKNNVDVASKSMYLKSGEVVEVDLRFNATPRTYCIMDLWAATGSGTNITDYKSGGEIIIKCEQPQQQNIPLNLLLIGVGILILCATILYLEEGVW